MITMLNREIRGLLWSALVLLALIIAFVLVFMWSPQAAQLPGGYAGRPPTDLRYPGRCWCVVHGPRGGCRHWQCKPKKHSQQ